MVENISLDYGIIIAQWQNALIVMANIIGGIIGYWALSKVRNYILSSYCKYDNQINKIGDCSHSQTSPVAPAHTVGNHGTCAKNNNEAYEYPKKQLPVVLVHCTYSPLWALFKRIISKLISWVQPNANKTNFKAY